MDYNLANVIKLRCISLKLIKMHRLSKPVTESRCSSPELGREFDSIQRKEENAKQCLQFYSESLGFSDVVEPWATWKDAKPSKQPRVLLTSRDARPRLTSRCNRGSRAAPIRTCNRTPLILSTRLIQNHESTYATQGVIKKPKPRLDKENLLARQIKRANRLNIKPHSTRASPIRQQIEIVNNWMRRRSDKSPCPLESILRKLETSRGVRQQYDGKFPPLFIKTYDVKLL